MKTFLTDLTG